MEVMITLTILVILAGLVVPSFIGARETSRLNAAARKVLATLRYCRNQAIVKATAHRFVVDTAEGAYWVERFEADPERGDEVGYVEDASSLGRKRALPEGITIKRGVIGTGRGGEGAASASSGRGAPPVTQDQAVVSFTPEGQSDASVFWLENEEGEQVFIGLDPQTAVSRILGEDEIQAVKEELKIE